MARQKKPKKDRSAMKYALVDLKTDEGQELVKLVKETLEYPEHTELKGAKILCAWMLGLKKDRDGHLVLGKAYRPSELERIRDGVDLIVKLNQAAWRELSERQRLALLDHELSHFATVPGPDGVGEAKDSHGRTRYRIRRHDIEDFRAVVKRHGSYKEDLRSFVDAALAGDQQLALPDGEMNRTLRIAK